MKIVLIALLCLLLTACPGEVRPNLPETVTLIAEKDRDFPSWSTEPLPEPAPANDTLGELARSHDARGGVNTLANCHRALMRQLQRGEDVDPKSCDKGGAP